MKPNRATIRFVRITAPLLVAIALAAASRADTVVLTPTADAFVCAAQPANNFGAAGALSTAANLARGEFQTVIRFDAASAATEFDAAYGPGTWAIQSIALRLTAAAPNNAIFNPSAAGSFNVGWMQNDSWVEGTGTPGNPTTTGITFATLPSFLSPNDETLGMFFFSGGTSGSLVYALQPTSLFIDDLRSGGLIGLRLDAADDAVSYLCNSRSIASESSRPQLFVTAVPEPASAVLVGLFSVAFLRRRSRLMGGL